MKAIGIDLGTTNSASAIAGDDIRVLPTRAGEQLTPSVVGFVTRRKATAGEIVAGRQAVNNAVRDPANTIFSIKRLMGRIHGETKVEEIRERGIFRLAEAPSDGEEDQAVRVRLHDQSLTPTEISSIILRQIKADAELALGEPVTHAVVTVPAYFEERQRTATASACQEAGLRVIKVIDEPTAAAIAFGVGKEEQRHRVLVYDLGGGTFDISIIQMTGGNYTVLTMEGNNWLGGDDFDRVIVQRMIDWVKEEYDHDPSDDETFVMKAKEEAQRTKIALSTQSRVEIFAPVFLKIPELGPVDIDLEITREEFEEAVRPYVAETIELVRTAMENQSLSTDDITEVLLVGGSTGVPLVQEEVSKLFGAKKIKRYVNPMECVALGAAILAAGAELEDDGDDVSFDRVLDEVTAMNLGIAAVQDRNTDVFVPIIPKGTPYPLTNPMSEIFYPTTESQQLIRVPVYEGMNERASLNEQQGTIEFPLPVGISAATPVEVSFNYDANRILTVAIRVVGTEHFIEQTLTRDRARPKVEQAAPSLKDDWREDLQPSVRAARHFLENYGPYMDDDDRDEMEQALRGSEEALEEQNEVEGTKLTRVLDNKIMGSGVASLLFMAERVMHDAPADTQKELADATAALRVAHERKDTRKVEEISMGLRMVVAQFVARRSGVREVQDVGYKDLLKKAGGLNPEGGR